MNELFNGEWFGEWCVSVVKAGNGHVGYVTQRGHKEWSFAAAEFTAKAARGRCLQWLYYEKKVRREDVAGAFSPSSAQGGTDGTGHKAAMRPVRQGIAQGKAPQGVRPVP